MEFLFILGLSAITIGLLSLWEGFVFLKLWGWFVVPTFGLPMITIPVAIGLALLISFLTHQMRTEDDKEPLESAIKLFSYGFVNAGTILLIGWIVTFFL